LLAGLVLPALAALLSALTGLLLLLAGLLLAAAALLLAGLVLTTLLLAGILLVRIVHDRSYLYLSLYFPAISTVRHCRAFFKSLCSGLLRSKSCGVGSGRNPLKLQAGAFPAEKLHGRCSAKASGAVTRPTHIVMDAWSIKAHVFGT
jgi:hypothetical protein